MFLLLAVALLPVWAFFRYLRYMDRAEPEPDHLVNSTLWYGIVSAFPVVVLELLYESAFGKPPKEFGPLFVHCLIGVALIEEAGKLWAGLQHWDHPEFNEENDGIVYVTAASLGFAGIENVLYVMQEGFGAGVMRALLSIPLHMCCGVIMGYYAGLAKFAEGPQRRAYLVSGFVYAVVIHGVYDACLLSGQVGLVLTMFLGSPVFCFRTINRLMTEGREMSLKRLDQRRKYSGSPDQPAIQDPGTPIPQTATVVQPAQPSDPVPRPPTLLSNVALLLSYVIFSACGLFWFIILTHIATHFSDPDLVDGIIGSVILTGLPWLCAQQLYRYGNRSRAAMKLSAQPGGNAQDRTI